jgi:hypothetical protein
MTARGVTRWLAAVALLLAAGCGGGDGERPELTTTSAPGAGATTTTRPPVTTTTRPPLTTTTRQPITTTSVPQATTTTAVATTTVPETTTTVVDTTTTASDEEVAGAPASDEGDDDTTWWWLLALAVVAALVGLFFWWRSRKGPGWEAQASQLAEDIDAAGRSVLLGPDLTTDLWETALAHSTDVRVGAGEVLEHAPTTSARQAVQEAIDALRSAEIAANTARTTPGSDVSAARATLAAAVERLRVVARPPTSTP